MPALRVKHLKVVNWRGISFDASFSETTIIDDHMYNGRGMLILDLIAGLIGNAAAQNDFLYGTFDEISIVVSIFGGDVHYLRMTGGFDHEEINKFKDDVRTTASYLVRQSSKTSRYLADTRSPRAAMSAMRLLALSTSSLSFKATLDETANEIRTLPPGSGVRYALDVAVRLPDIRSTTVLMYHPFQTLHVGAWRAFRRSLLADHQLIGVGFCDDPSYNGIDSEENLTIVRPKYDFSD